MMDDPKEVFTVVNENDTIIGYRSRFDCHHDNTLIHRAIGVIVYNDKDEILLQKRSMTKDTSPGLWTLSVSGHVDRGETYEEAAKRESREELGVDLTLIFSSKFITKMAIETEMDADFIAYHNGPFHINSDETEKVQFFTKEQIQAMRHELTPFAQIALEKLGVLTEEGNITI